MHVFHSQKDSTNHDINILETIHNLWVLYEKKSEAIAFTWVKELFLKTVSDKYTI